MTEIAPATEEIAPEAWVTVRLLEPSPNTRFASFVHVAQDGSVAVEVRAVDFVALQHIADDDGELAESRIVPVVVSWKGEADYLVRGGPSGFVAVAAAAAEAEKMARDVANTILTAAAAAAPPAAAP